MPVYFCGAAKQLSATFRSIDSQTPISGAKLVISQLLSTFLSSLHRMPEEMDSTREN